MNSFIRDLKDAKKEDLRKKQLDCIRLRCRLVDKDEIADAASSEDTEKSETYFTLGASAIASGGITLARIEAAGQVGVLDLDTVYYSECVKVSSADQSDKPEAGGSNSVGSSSSNVHPKDEVIEDDENTNENKAGSSIAEDRLRSEEAVPPVVLLYQ